jgi:hypothetical protein
MRGGMRKKSRRSFAPVNEEDIIVLSSGDEAPAGDGYRVAVTKPKGRKTVRIEVRKDAAKEDEEEEDADKVKEEEDAEKVIVKKSLVVGIKKVCLWGPTFQTFNNYFLTVNIYQSCFFCRHEKELSKLCCRRIAPQTGWRRRLFPLVKMR